MRFALRASTSLGSSADLVAQRGDVRTAIELVVVDRPSSRRARPPRPAGVVTSGLISASEQPLSMNAVYSCCMIFAAARACLHVVVEEEPELHRLVRLQAVARVDRQLHDLLRRLRRDFLDVDAAGRAHHEHRLLRRAVDDDADVASLAMSAAGVTSTFWTVRPLICSRGSSRALARFLGRLGELHAARLAAAAGVHLRLHDHRAAELARDRFRDIEEVAAKTPEKILKLAVDPRYGLQPYQAMQLGFFLYDDVKQARAAAKIMQQLYTAFMKSGCSLAEINPLVTTPAGEVVALDAKMVDRRQRARSPAGDRRAARRDRRRNQAKSRRATRTSPSSSSTATSAACVNGAGLAMATMDLVKYYGGEPANFLDIGGSSNPRRSSTRSASSRAIRT